MAWKKIALDEEVIHSPGSLEKGDILYYDGTNWVKLAPGSAGQVLSTGGTGADPSWITVTSTDEKVKADSSDPNAGYLSDKMDNVTLEEDSTSHKIRVKNAGITVAKLNIDNDLGFNYHSLIQFAVQKGTDLPNTGNEVEGQLFYDTTDGHLYVYGA